MLVDNEVTAAAARRLLRPLTAAAADVLGLVKEVGVITTVEGVASAGATTMGDTAIGTAAVSIWPPGAGAFELPVAAAATAALVDRRLRLPAAARAAADGAAASPVDCG